MRDEVGRLMLYKGQRGRDARGTGQWHQLKLRV